ncbi:putative alpha/beta hydrolase [Zalerion maritima]|uniref:Alpha/beta hydrolase n=1 Tax=Zalerion maritima TaxID=339359 RepID=A0AAD5RX27_9PEZI|nr:putative alpha/beta hydrolase [Zalerion maritima]
MAATTTVEVPHLGGIAVGYRLSANYDASKPTVVMINSMCTTVSLYNAQFEDSKLTDSMNLLAVEPLGHGATSTRSAQHWTYWDTAAMALQAMTALKIEKAFALGTSQGGWMVVRMALLAPERILGLLPLGTSMDYESADSRSKGCWDPKPLLSPFLQSWTSPTPTPDFVVDEIWAGMVATLGFGSAVSEETVAFWKKTVMDVYTGDEGRMKARMSLICLLERDGLMLRVGDIKCPVYWLQGTADVPYASTVPVEQLKLFTSAKETKFTLVEGGAHYLNATSPKEVGEAMLEMVGNIRHGPNLRFIGREEELRTLHLSLDPDEGCSGMKAIAIHGLGSGGKSELDPQHANAVRKRDPLIAWFPSDGPADSRAPLAQLIRKLDLPRNANARQVRDQPSLAPVLFLLVFDNVISHHLASDIWSFSGIQEDMDKIASKGPLSIHSMVQRATLNQMDDASRQTFFSEAVLIVPNELPRAWNEVYDSVHRRTSTFDTCYEAQTHVRRLVLLSRK